ncbi:MULTISPECIES: tyrosine-type recombinase/integrase [Vibrio]|uniref:tyrosine-type recombinase/integrase n=1 Tax=Vibrio TaxID=662 RepID=UPI0006195359|nr:MULTISPECIES: tyrosine-type recombinase/integrase [Vibrio]
MDQIGLEARSKNRLKQIERVKNKARQLFEKQFPNPSHIPTQDNFHDKWMLYLSDITETFGAHKDYRRAFNWAVKQVLSYQEQYNWKVTPPSYIVTNKPPKQLRTLEWMQRAWRVHNFYQHWYQQLLSKPVDDQAQSFCNVVLSFIFHSGHCTPCVVKAFIEYISGKSLALKQWDETPFVSLLTKGGSFNTNIKVDEQPLTQFQCYLHPVTLGLLRTWRRWKDENWCSPNDESSLMKILTGNNLSLTFDQLCCSGVYVCEQHQGVSINQALVEYQVGSTKSYSLPTCDLARILHPEVAIAKYFAPQSTKHASNKSTSHKIERNFDTSIDTYQELKVSLYPKNGAKELSKKKLLVDLNALVERIKSSPEQVNERLIVDWYRHKLSTTCGIPTIKRYHANLTRKWIYLCNQNQLDKLESDDLESIYQNAIETQPTIKSQKYFTARLKDLHGFAVEHYNFAQISEQYLHSDPTQTHTRSGFIDEALFLALINTIEASNDFDDADKLCLQSISIIAYRCGLRISEIRKLRMKDIEQSNIGWLSIRSSYLGENKTASSLRKVPLHPLLLEHEEDIINKYFHLKFEQQTSKTKPFFSLGHANLPFSTFEVSHLIGCLLKALSLNNHLVFHHLRHACLSKLQLLLELPDNHPIPNQLIPYDEQQRQKIKATVFGRSLMTGYDAIAAFAGHESPAMTFRHYFHFSDWIVAHKLSLADYSTITKKEAHHLGLLPKNTVSDTNNNQILKESSAYLIRKLRVKYLETQVEEGKVPALSLMMSDHEVISIPICYQALTTYNKGFQVGDICAKYRLKQRTVDKWIKNAMEIKSYATESKGTEYRRHFTSARIDKLLPAQLKTEAEQLRLNQYASKLNEALKDDSKRHAIQDAIKYALQHTSPSRSGIYFNSPDRLEQFVEACHSFIPKTHWRAATQFVEKSIQLEEWRLATKGISSYSERKPSGRSKKSRGAIRLELIHPHTQQGKKLKVKRSSSTLMYLFHMMGIMML